MCGASQASTLASSPMVVAQDHSLAFPILSMKSRFVRKSGVGCVVLVCAMVAARRMTVQLLMFRVLPLFDWLKPVVESL